MAKYFKSRLIYFHSQRKVKIKPESEMSSHITLLSVISGLFHTRYIFTAVVRTGNSQPKVSYMAPTPPADILAVALTGLSRLYQGKVA